MVGKGDVLKKKGSITIPESCAFFNNLIYNSFLTSLHICTHTFFHKLILMANKAPFACQKHSPAKKTKASSSEPKLFMISLACSLPLSDETSTTFAVVQSFELQKN